MSEKCKCTFPGAIQVKKRPVSIEDKFLKKVNELTHVVMLDLLIVAYTQFVIMAIELQKVLSQKLKCLYSMSTQFFWNEWYHNYGCESLTFLLH